MTKTEQKVIAKLILALYAKHLYEGINIKGTYTVNESRSYWNSAKEDPIGFAGPIVDLYSFKYVSDLMGDNSDVEWCEENLPLMPEYETSNCCICNHPVSTADVPNKDAWENCGDCGKPTCGDHRENTSAARCTECQEVSKTYSPVSIAKSIREQIFENVNGRGPAVIGQDKHTGQHRITDARVHKGIVQGKALNTGKWFKLAGYKVVR